MPSARDIAGVFEQIAPIETGLSNDQLGFIYGDPVQEVTGLACLWNIHSGSLQTCVDLDVNMLICHEGIWMGEQKSGWYDGPSAEEIHSNRVRRQMLDEQGMVVYRSHSNWDALETDGVPDQAIGALGIAGLDTVARQKFFSVQRLPEEMTAQALYENVRTGLGFTPCRLFGDGDKQIRTFAFLIGGFGENQYHMPQAARDLGAEAIIIGEMSEFIVIACLEMGLPVIESLHSVSEMPAIKRQAEMMGERLPGLPVHYVPSGATSFYGSA
jgi:putative NIF3 family GTP cyclohydrolase 1 type 2